MTSRKTRTLWLRLHCLKSSSQRCDPCAAGKTPDNHQLHRLLEVGMQLQGNPPTMSEAQ